MLQSLLFWCVLSYLSGSVMYSYYVPKITRGIDVRAQSKDNNPGTANAVKQAGVPTGLVCLALDMAKGYLPVFFAQRYIPASEPLFLLVIALPVYGHAFPVFLGFRGGKAIATSFGVLLALLPTEKSVFLLAFFYLLFLFLHVKPDELNSCLTFGLFALWTAMLAHPLSVKVGCALISAVVMWKNRREALAAVKKILRI